MKKAKLFWIIYFAVIGVVALFFSIFVNQGLGGTFSVKNKKGEIKTFNSYLFVDFNKIEGERKTKYNKLLTQYNEKSKKQVEIVKANELIEKISKMIEISKDRDKVLKKLNTNLKATEKRLKTLNNTLSKAKGARKERVQEQVDKVKKSLSKVKSELAQIDVSANEAKEIAAKVRKRMSSPNMSIVDALLSERTRLKKVKTNYERTKAAYERELMQIKKFIDIYRTEKILAAIANNKVKQSGTVPSDVANFLPTNSMEFLIIAQDISKKMPDSIGLKPVPNLSAAAIQELQNATEEKIKEEINQSKNKVANLLKKIKEQGTTDELKEQLKNAKNALKTSTQKLQNKKILDIIVSNFTDLIDKSSELYGKYVEQIVAQVKAEGMPLANFLTLGIYLGKYAKGFPLYGDIVKEHENEGKMKLRGTHRIEERLLGNRASVRKGVARKVFGVGEILTFRLMQTELDQFVNGFKALENNIKVRLEQGGASTFNATGTSGGGGQTNLPAVNPSGGEGDGQTNLPAVNPSGGEGDGQTNLPAVNPNDGSSPDSGGGEAPSGADVEGPLNKKEMQQALKLSTELQNIYSSLKPFFGSDSVELSAGTVSDVYKSINLLIKFFDKLKTKYPKILNQKTIDTSEAGMGMEITIKDKFDNAFGKIKNVNQYIQANIVSLTKITNSGTWTKRILIFLLMLAGAFLAYLTYIWDKKEKVE